MFRTYPEAEQMLPPPLAPHGERSWRWAELPLQIPYFLLSVTVKTEEGSFRRHFLFSHIGDVIGILASPDSTFSNIEVGLLSPGYMNGGNSYQLTTIKEVWEDQNKTSQLFVTVDGNKLHFPPNENEQKNPNFELILCLN